MTKRDIKVVLQEMLDSITAIGVYLNGLTHEQFLATPLVQDAVIRRLDVLGAAVNNLPDDWKLQHPNVPWRLIADMRNRLIHGYFSVDLELVWNTAGKDLPAIEPELRTILQNAP